MALDEMHPEDVKAELRKRFGTVAAFERENALPAKSVTDLLRGYKSKRVEEAVESAIAVPITSDESERSGSIRNNPKTHRLNAEVR